MIRKGLGKNQGKGYKNMVVKDPMVHSMSAKGIKSQVRMNPIKIDKSKYVLDKYGDKELSIRERQRLLNNYEKKGFIKDIARQVSNGVKWAIEWEKEHLPEQEEWVKKEYNDAKESIRKGLDNVEHLSEQEKDVHDIRDELDNDNDGTPDKDIEDLEMINEDIKWNLENIDLDDNGIADAHDDGTFKIHDDKPFTQSKVNSNFSNKIKTGVQDVKDYIERKKTGYETKQFFTEKEQQRIKDLSDKELKKLAIRDDSDENGNIFSIFSSQNKYEKELIRRETKQIQLKEEIKQAKIKAKEESKKPKESIFSI